MSHHGSKLTRANLGLHDKAPLTRAKECQTYGMERFREEEDPYRRFLVTGESLYQKEQRKDKTPVTINKPKVQKL